MPKARLTLTIPDGVWMGEVTRTHPGANFRVLAVIPDDRSGVVLVEITAPDLAELLAEVQSRSEVTDFDTLARTDGEALVQFETTSPLMLLPARDSGVPLELPFDVSAGQVVWEVIAPTDRLSKLGSQLDQFGIQFTVDHVRQDLVEDALLTETQQEILEAAIEAGYYDTPRTSSLTELAEDLDIAKSTASEILHRAEEKVVKDYASRLTDGPQKSG